MFNGTTTGMQFPPREWSGASWNADGTKDLVVYDPHLMQVSTYKYLEDTTLGSKDLVLAMYNSSWQGGVDIGFAYDLPLMMHSIDCGDCTNSTTQAASNYSINVYD